MRRELVEPISDKRKLQSVASLVTEIYRQHEAGVDYSETLRTLGRLTGRIVSSFEIDSAFGSVDANTFACDLLLDRSSIPSDLTREEMLELVEAICNARGNLLYSSFWIACLKVNTGDDRISDLIYWPGEYFGDGDNARKLSSQEILDTALATTRPRNDA